MEPRPYLRCLGQPALFSPAGEPVRFRTRKHLALLVYLAVEHRPVHRRDRLAELFWPAVTLREARHSLATALSVLRPRVGPGWLAADRDSVTLNPGALALDLERLLAGDILGTEVTGPLEVAAFLDGFDLPGTGEFGLWKDRQQARLLPAIKSALVVLIDRCRRTGDSRQIELLADRMLALDELSEEAIRAKMEARAFAGDRLTALKIFEEWKEKLAEELGAVPSELVEGMAVRLRRRGWERTTLSHIPPVPTDQWRGRPFIGRAAEYRVLYEAWEGMRTGVPGHALVLGDSGIGKTTLVGRLTTAAGLQGAAISRVQCYDLEREIPYATLGNLIHGLLDRPGVSATPPEELAELARTVPEVRRRFPSIPPPEESQGETARIRLTEAFHQMLLAVAEEHPVILVVDDLHLADDASLAVLHLVMRRSRGQPIMVVLIARPGELPRSPQAARLREAGESLGIRELELPPLTEEESREFLAALIDTGSPDASARRTLLRGARGIPMVLELLLQDWRANGNQSLAFAVDAMTTHINVRSAQAAFYNNAIDRIGRTLDAGPRNVLSLAAILGRRLNDLAMYRLVDLGMGQTMSGMSDLVRRRVLRDSGSGLEFANELVRGASYLAVPSSMRKALHSGIADRLIEVSQGDPADLGLEIAWHCMRAGRSREAIPYLLVGAREAKERGALHEAERGLSTALHHLKPPHRVEAVLLLTQILQEQGAWAESLKLLDVESIDTAQTGCRISHVLRLMAQVNQHGIEPEEMRQHISYLQSVIQSNEPLETRVIAARVAAYFVGDLRSPTDAKRVLDAVSELPTIEVPAETLARIALVKAILLFQLHERQSSLHEIETAAAHMRLQNLASSTACQLQAGLGTIKSNEGAYIEALGFLHNAYRIATRLDNDTMKRDLSANIALSQTRLGNYDAAYQWARQSMEFGPTSVTSFVQVLSCFCFGFAAAMKGNTQEAAEIVAAMERRMPGLLPPWAIQAWRLYSADVLHLAGKEHDAKVSASRATFEQDGKLFAPDFAGPFARWVSRLGSQGRVDEARRLIEQLLTRIRSYDPMDRAEILAARLHLDHVEGRHNSDREEMLHNALRNLPPAVTIQLRKLGFLSQFVPLPTA